MTTLIGTNPDQVPVNSMLGGMAYQDPESVSVTNLSYSGTLTGGTGVINIGSNQIYKDATGNVGIGNSPVSNGKTLTLVNTSTGNSSFFLQNSTTGFTATDGTLLQLDGSASYLWNFENSTLSLGTNNTEYVRLTGAGDLLNLGTGATKLQEGTTAQRPASPQEGMIRKNSTLGVIEVYSSSEWFSLQGGLLNVQVFASAALTTYTPTPGTRKIIVELLGGGGGGAYRPATSAGQVAVPSPGNNGAGLVVKYNFTLTAGQTGSVAIGFGGNGGLSPGSNGSNGQSTSFSIGGYSVSVGGGLGGTYAAATSTFPVVKISAGYTSAPSVTGFTVLKDASSGPTSLAVYSPALFAPHLRNSPASSVDTTKGQGNMSFSSENSTTSVGSPGTDGKVIIYEYS